MVIKDKRNNQGNKMIRQEVNEVKVIQIILNDNKEVEIILV
jgi:hypothetical protein